MKIIRYFYCWFLQKFSIQLIFKDICKRGLDIRVAKYKFRRELLEPATEYNTIVVHHTGNIPYMSIKRLRKFHMEKRRFGAIGYHFVINRAGQIFYTRPLCFKGAHAVPNEGKIGIAFSMNLNWRKVPKKALESYNELVKFLMKKYRIKDTNIIGHVQQQIRILDELLMKENIAVLVTEKDILNIKSLSELKKLKKDEIARLKNHRAAKKILPRVRCLKACPGFNFYRYLKKDKIL